MVFATFFTSLVNVLLSTFHETILGLCLSIDGIIYNLLSYAFNLFLVMCQINMDYAVALVGGLIDRLQAVVMVFIVFKLGMELIQYLLNPEDSVLKKGSELIKNVFITAALLISYTFIFGIVNDLSMLVIGSSGTYNYNTLSQIVDVSPEADEGLIMRFIFGKGSKVDDIGDYISYKTLSMFVRSDNEELEKTITDGDEYNFMKLSNILSKVDKSVSYTPVLSGFVGVYLIYSIAMCAIQIGIRMFKLVILQILAPVAIFSIIKDGVKGKTFSGYVKLYGSTVIDAFFRIASMLIVTVFICKFFLSIGDFFNASTEGSEGISSMLITIAVIIAGYKFANEIPAFINKALGTSMDEKGKGGLASWLGHTASFLAGGAIGGVAGAAGGLIRGLTGGAGLASLGNAVAGFGRGAAAGAKGNSVADKIKNMKGVGKANATGAADFARRGFGGVVGGAIGNTFGVGRSQDLQMYKYDQQMSALDELEAAQIFAIKNDKVSGYGTNYDSRISDLSYGDSRDDFASKAVQYDKSLAAAKADLEIAKKSGVGVKEKELAYGAAFQKANDAAKKLYDNKRNNASNEEISQRRKEIQHSVGNKLKTNTDGSINVKDSKRNLDQAKRDIARKNSYRNTHGAPKDK